MLQFLDLIRVYKVTHPILHEEFKEKFKSEDHEFLLSNIFGVFMLYFNSFTIVRFACHFYCKLFSEIPNICDMKKVHLKHKVHFYIYTF